MKIDMPRACCVDLSRGLSLEAYCAELSPRNRRHLRKEILEFEDTLSIEIINKPSDEDIERIENFITMSIN